MRKLVPIRGSVLCRKIRGGTHTETVNGLKVVRVEVDLYEILDMPQIPVDGCNFKVGDIVMSNSTGDAIEINPGEIVYLFKVENLMCALDKKKEEK